MNEELLSHNRVPFILAVTGHRDPRPEDLPAIRHEIEGIFRTLAARMRSTPLLLLSGLAEGADQIVAEVALEQGVGVVAVLPMPLEVYRTTMSAEAAASLDRLLLKVQMRIDLPTGSVTAEQLLASEAARSTCYGNLAVYLARYCQVLIALWDGVHSDKLGGTANVVRNVRSGVRMGEVNEVESGCGMVYQVVTPRVSGGDAAPREIRTFRLACRPARAADTEHDEAPAGEGVHAQQVDMQIEKDLERFNRAALLATKSGRKRSALRVGDEVLSAFAERVEDLYGLADAISVRANGQRKLVLLMILMTAVSGTIFYGVHGELMPRNVLLWFTFPLFVIIAVVLYQVARLLHVDQRYLDTRALAEALRVQFYWELAGVDQAVERFCLVNRQQELDWIRVALKNIWLLHQGTAEPAAPVPNMAGAVERWVKDQRAWYERKAYQQARLVRQRERISSGALLTAVGWSILVPASLLIPGPWHALVPWSEMGAHVVEGGLDWYGVMHIALAVPALLAGAYRLWIEQSGYEEQAREYRFMEHEFAVRERALAEHLHSLEASQQILLELGIAALQENGRWLLLHRERPLEVMSAP